MALPFVPQTILEQLGKGTLFMLGTFSVKVGGIVYSSEDPTWVSIRIKGSPLSVNYLKISLINDEYRMEFGRIHGTKYTVKKVVEGVYFDQLHEMIETYTALRTQIPVVIFSKPPVQAARK